MKVAVSARDLRREFGPKVAVEGVSFEVGEREIYGFLGPNGAGKTTTLRMLLGLLPPSGGRAEVLGIDPSREPHRLRARVGYVSQLHSLYEDLTVEENLRFFARVYGLAPGEGRRATLDAVERFDLAPAFERLVGSQPTGVRRRTALAAALLHDPELLVLDEPTSGMDPGSRRLFWNFLGGLVGAGKTVIITTHHLEEVEACDRLGVILDGSLVFEGTPSALRGTYGRQVLEVRAGDWGRVFLELKKRYGASLAGRAVRVDPERVDRRELSAVLAGEGLEDYEITAGPPTLEDAFLKLAEGKRAAGSAAGRPA